MLLCDYPALQAIEMEKQDGMNSDYESFFWPWLIGLILGFGIGYAYRKEQEK